LVSLTFGLICVDLSSDIAIVGSSEIAYNLCNSIISDPMVNTTVVPPNPLKVEKKNSAGKPSDKVSPAQPLFYVQTEVGRRELETPTFEISICKSSKRVNSN
jgi:hypothetical protein